MYSNKDKRIIVSNLDKFLESIGHEDRVKDFIKEYENGYLYEELKRANERIEELEKKDAIGTIRIVKRDTTVPLSSTYNTWNPLFPPYQVTC